MKIITELPDGLDAVLERSHATNYMFVVSVFNQDGEEVARSREFIDERQARYWLKRVEVRHVH